ncbi:hypothetical protein G8A07_06955 [Roseateles sp. DAIF2]|uniref:hypothetical protein n=1 Tax=Roseateles sp. DAIF2 TaxID=2714952 RepID=UPI0018A27C7E|nr:hypothetical protein [Roseateles sp. DAIF2]QPF72692.1 hypothetical protein G8A07_06955 [Roseateles sp. DAIF2]
MSLAGKRSNRGDSYQVAVAAWEVLSLIDEGADASLELDATFLMGDGKAIAVDDIVLTRADGSKVCFQSKKNQPDFAVWSVEVLAKELRKVGEVLAAEPNVAVRFVSRGDFGELAKLIELARSQSDESSLRTAIGANLKRASAQLDDIWRTHFAGGLHSLHAFLTRIRCTPMGEIEDIQALTKERLRRLVSRPDDAFNAIWTTLDNLGSNVSAGQATAFRSRITRDELIALLSEAGCELVPSRAIAEISHSLHLLSAVGRDWHRDIDGEIFDRSAVEELRQAIDGGEKKVVLTDGPGAGKTCALLTLMDVLEKDGKAFPVFIQAREFSKERDPAGRSAMGMPENLPYLVSAMSEQKPVVVVVDSLDVLSLERDTTSLTFFLGLIERLARIPNTTVVAACRSFDLKYNSKLSRQTWSRQVTLGLLDWDTMVVPLLNRWGVSLEGIAPSIRDLLRNPRNLAIFCDVAKAGGPTNISSAYSLTQAYLNAVVVKDEELGRPAFEALSSMAKEMLSRRSLTLPRGAITLPDSTVSRLLSCNVLAKSSSGQFQFGHQTLLDALAVKGAVDQGTSLKDFIVALPAVPFVRPTVRAFFDHLFATDPSGLRKQLRAVFASDAAAHIKSLLVELLAETVPTTNDHNLVQHLYREHAPLFRKLYFSSTSADWYELWKAKFLPRWIQESNREWLQTHTRTARRWVSHDPQGVLALWTLAASSDWFDGQSARDTLAYELVRMEGVDWTTFRPLIELLASLPHTGVHDFLADVIKKFVQATNSGDDLLWEYISGGVTRENVEQYRFGGALRLPHAFSNRDFLRSRLAQSDELLTAAIQSMEAWDEMRRRPEDPAGRWSSHFIEHTSFEVRRTNRPVRSPSEADGIFMDVEQAVISRANGASTWWVKNASSVCLNPCGAIRYMGMAALTHRPQGNETVIRQLLIESRLYESDDLYEVGELISAALPAVPDLAPDVENQISRWHQAVGHHRPGWVASKLFLLLESIPAPLRSEATQAAMNAYLVAHERPIRTPSIRAFGGWVAPPFSVAELSALGEDKLIELLQGTDGLGRHHSEISSLVGGRSSVVAQMVSVAELRPQHYLRLLRKRWSEVASDYREAIFDGVSTYIRRARGELQASNDWAPEHADANELAASLIDEMEHHSSVWVNSGAVGSAMVACAHVVASDDALTHRLTFIATTLISRLATAELTPVSDDLLSEVLNSTPGQVADALMILATEHVELKKPIPTFLRAQLMRLLQVGLPHVSAGVLRRLPYLNTQVDFGWELYECAVAVDDDRVYAHADDFIYYNYAHHFDRLSPLLDRMRSSAREPALESWGRLTALASLDGRVELGALLDMLKERESDEAWHGAVTVWTSNAGAPLHQAACFAGLEAALEFGPEDVGRDLSRLWRDDEKPIRVPASLVRSVLQRQGASGPSVDVFGMDEWCRALGDTDLDMALEVLEAMAPSMAPNQYSYGAMDALPTLLTALLNEAQEREESDGQAMLQRVVRVQDQLYAIAGDTMTEWLEEAERPS